MADAAQPKHQSTASVICNLLARWMTRLLNKRKAVMLLNWRGNQGEEPQIWRVRCAACGGIVGYAIESQVPKLADAHGKVCPATDEQRQQALFDMHFAAIVAGIEDEEEDDDGESE